MNPAVNYTARGYGSVRQALIDRVKLRFPNDWTEVVQTTVAMSFLDIVAWSHEQRTYYYDLQATNCYLETADLPESIVSLARQLGYKRRLATAASVPVTLFPNPPQATSISIPKAQPVQIGNDLVFEAAEDYVIPAGQPVWPEEGSEEIIVFVEGETKTEEFLSDGTAFQTFGLSHPSVIQGSVNVSVLDEEWTQTSSLVFIEGSGIGRDTFIGDGEDNQTYELQLLHAFIDPTDEDVLILMISLEPWKMVEEFTGAPKEFRAYQNQDGITTIRFGRVVDDSAPQDFSVIDAIYQITGSQKRYVVDFDANSRATVAFGDGLGGIVPLEGATITVSYRVGGGVQGNIRRGKLDDNIRGILPSGANVNVRVFNSESGSGGEEIETLERVKQLAPKFAKTNERAVTNEDFTVLAMTFYDPRYGAPAFASAKLKQRVPELNLVQVALWSRDEMGRVHTASTPLKQGVKSHLDAHRTITTYVEIVDGDILYFDIFAAILLRDGRTISSVLPLVTDTLRAHFNSTFVSPGIDLSLALISKVILEVDYVDNVTLTAVQGSRLIQLDLGRGDTVEKNFVAFFDLPGGQELVPGSVEVSAGEQTASDDGKGNLLGNIDEAFTNELNYETGRVEVTFATPPGVEDFVTAEARYYARMLLDQTEEVSSDNRIDGITDFSPLVQRKLLGWSDGVSIDSFLPEQYLPYDPHHVVIIGGYDKNGSHPGGQLMAFDDGSGGIVGDVQTGGLVNYDTGEIAFTWNTTPPPSGYTDYWGYLLSAPDGSKVEFDFEIQDAPGGTGNKISMQTLSGEGRLKFLLSDLNTINVEYEVAYDNGSGDVDGPDLNKFLTNEIRYHDLATLTSEGRITFLVAPDPSSGQDFRIQIAPTSLFLYTPFVAYILGTIGYDKIIVADGSGQFLRDIGSQYPYSRLDFKTGRYLADLNSPSAEGRTMNISYHSFVVSDCRDIPISHLTMPTFSKAVLTEVTKSLNT